VGGTFAEIDHSGDIGIEAWGEDLAEMLAAATRGLLALMCRGGVEPRAERRIRVTSASGGDLLVDWLGEVISVADARGELYAAVEIARVGEWFAEGVLRGEKADVEKHDLRFEVKGATYHGLTVEQRADGCYGRVIFDL
jgi:SHS2 domain-containing protein